MIFRRQSTERREERIKLGRPDVHADTPSHTKGIKEGNSIGNYEHQEGHLPDGRCTAAKSTGINASDRDPIDPRMPNLPPS